MPLGYGYVKREATDYVNWAEIGKNMSDMLANENKIREEKKAAIDEDSRQIGLYLANAPTGQDANAKTAALKLADDATQYKNLQLKLLKSGKLKLKDYLVNTQNLKDSITQAFDAMTDYQKEFGARMDEYRANTLSRISVDDMADVEGFGNWLKSGFYVNPTNGVVNVALKDKKIIDGKEIYSMSENPNKVASMNYIRGLINTRVSKADVQKSTDEWASKLGKEVKWDKALSYVGNYYRGGKDFTIEDITSRQDIDPLTKDVIFEFKKAEEDYVNGVLVNPYVRGSVLIDYVGTAPNKKEYRITNDEADAKANPEAIYRKIDPSTQQGELIFNDEQKKVSEKYITNIARSKYNYEQKVQSTAQAQDQYNKDRENREKERRTAENFGQNLTWMLSGNDNEAAEGTKYISGETRLPIKRKTDGIEITDKQGNKQVFKFDENGQVANPLKLAKSIIGAVNNIDLNEDDVLKAVKRFMPKNATINKNIEASGFEEAATPPDPLSQYGAHVNNLISKSLTNDKGKPINDEELAYDKLNTDLAPLGAKVSLPFSYGNYIVVTAPNGVKSGEINLDDSGAQKAIADFLKGNPKGANPVEQKAWAEGLQKTGVVKTIDASQY